MARARPILIAFNRGLLSSSGLARVDIDRVRLSAEIQKNWMPRVLGTMSLRPGLEYTGATKSNNKARQIPFVFSTNDTADVEFSEDVMRVWVNDSLVARASVTSTIANSDFTSNVSGWTDSDESGATSSWATGGFLSLVGTETNSAQRDQQVTTSSANIEHAIRVVIERGTVDLSIGSTQGGTDYLSATLTKGTHSLVFTPAGTYWIRLGSDTVPASLVDSVTIESSGVMEIPIPYQEGDLPKIRYDQSGDIIFIACDGYQQRKIERRATRSWSFVVYETEDGPFNIINLTDTTITPSATTGDITLTASKSLFRSTHVGALFKLTQTGQSATADLSAEDTYTGYTRVTGVSGSRSFTISVTAISTSTVTLQRSVGEPGDWVDVESYTSTTVKAYSDGLDNQIIYYRLGIKAGDYGSDTVTCLLSYSSGSQSGVARITGYTSATVVNAAVLSEFAKTTATSDWYEGVWSDYRGWPSAVALHEGRLWWFGKDKTIGSVSDSYYSYDDETVGDSAPIQRSIGQGPVDSINFAMSLNRLIIGTDNNSSTVDAVRVDANSFLSIRSSSLDEPLTPTNFNIKSASSFGFYVDRSGQRVFQIAYNDKGFDYDSYDMTITVPDLFEGGISHIAVQQKPEIRLHCIKSDGTAGVLVFDQTENVQCWIEVETDGVVEDISVRPGLGEDQVYYLVKRTINGSTVRYREKWAMESECVGGTLNKQADSFLVLSPFGTTVAGLSHLEGEDVVVWGGGKDLGSYTVSSGSITISEAVSSVVVGLPYTADFKSTKLAYGAADGTSLLQKKRITRFGAILKNTHYQGLKYGPDFTYLDDLPLVDDGWATNEDKIWDHYDKDSMDFNGDWDTDSRLCLRAVAPRPCTVLAAVMTIDASDRS